LPTSSVACWKAEGTLSWEERKTPIYCIAILCEKFVVSPV